jgi:DNA-directed RNA polymerase specialized sigma subunit
VTKDRLKEYTWIRENIKNLEDRLLEIDTRLQKITNTLQTDIVQTTKDSDKWTLLIQKRMDVEELIKAEITNGFAEMEYIERVISKLPEREKLLMRLRYIDCISWEEICVKMHYEWRQTHYTHAAILKKIYKKECRNG